MRAGRVGGSKLGTQGKNASQNGVTNLQKWMQSSLKPALRCNLKPMPTMAIGGGASADAVEVCPLSSPFTPLSPFVPFRPLTPFGLGLPLRSLWPFGTCGTAIGAMSVLSVGKRKRTRISARRCKMNGRTRSGHGILLKGVYCQTRALHYDPQQLRSPHSGDDSRKLPDVKHLNRA